MKTFKILLALTIIVLQLNSAFSGDEILIPAGQVVLGNYPDGYGNYSSQVILLPAYYIDKYEVTNQEFAQFVADGGYHNQNYWIITGEADSLAGWNWKVQHNIQCPKFWDLTCSPYWKNDPYSRAAETPVVGISWFEAYAYARWAGKRLVTSAEWEKAARGNSNQFGTWNDVGVGVKFPWGNDFFTGQTPPEYHLCNWRLRYWAYSYPEKTKQWKTDGFKDGTAPVGSFSPAGDSPFGVADMAGNVWEWCADWDQSSAKQLKILRGGSWYDSGIEHLRTAFRYAVGPFLRAGHIGFRCARNMH